MSAPDNFYALLSSLLRQAAQNLDAPPDIPLKRWPAGSSEKFLLEDLQAALVALQTGNQNHPSQASGAAWSATARFQGPRPRFQT
ncbi:MAG: hypothetical protein P8Y03_06250 [Anaerolineales bacterium]|jgi:hypothetical protein